MLYNSESDTLVAGADWRNLGQIAMKRLSGLASATIEEDEDEIETGQISDITSKPPSGRGLPSILVTENRDPSVINNTVQQASVEDDSVKFRLSTSMRNVLSEKEIDELREIFRLVDTVCSTMENTQLQNDK